MRLLVTRPEPDAARLKARLENLGLEATVEPLVNITFNKTDDIDLSEAQALIVTSRNALRALAARPGSLEIARALPAFAVGEATAGDARALGFAAVVAGAGTFYDLVPQIVSMLDPSQGLIVHLAGDTLAGDLKGELEAHGFRVNQPVVYRTESSTRLTDATIEQMATGEIEGVILLSPRTATVYAELVARHGLIRSVREILHFCLSNSVARQLRAIGTIRIEIASRPQLEEVLALIIAAAARSGFNPHQQSY
jgi:uroporphyrinogen-III synthase